MLEQAYFIEGRSFFLHMDREIKMIIALGQSSQKKVSRIVLSMRVW